VAPVHRITKLPRRIGSQANEERLPSVPEQPIAVSEEKVAVTEVAAAIEPSAGNITDETIGRFREAVESIKDAPSGAKPSVEQSSIAEPAAETVVSQESATIAADSGADSNGRSATADISDTSSRAARFRSVSAEEFVLVDSRGERRAALSVAADGAPALTLSDAAGTVRAAVRLNFEGAPALVLYDAIGRRRLEVALKPDSTTGIGLYDEAGEGRAELVVAPSGSPSLTLFGPNGRRISRLPNTRER
jgi:hypothetical protein